MLLSLGLGGQATGYFFLNERVSLSLSFSLSFFFSVSVSVHLSIYIVREESNGKGCKVPSTVRHYLRKRC